MLKISKRPLKPKNLAQDLAKVDNNCQSKDMDLMSMTQAIVIMELAPGATLQQFREFLALLNLSFGSRLMPTELDALCHKLLQSPDVSVTFLCLSQAGIYAVTTTYSEIPSFPGVYVSSAVANRIHGYLQQSLVKKRASQKNRLGVSVKSRQLARS